MKLSPELILPKMSKITLGEAELNGSHKLLDLPACRQMHVPACACQPVIEAIDGQASIQKLSDTSLDFKLG